jgi:GNAT superfamily N-acetyltransferase
MEAPLQPHISMDGSLDAMYEAYINEVEGFEVLKSPEGFITYKTYPDHIYARDVYVVPEARKLGVARILFENLELEGRALGLTKLVTSIVPSQPGSDGRFECARKLGFRILQAQNDFIFLVKEI